MAGGNKKKPQMVREEEGVVTAQDEAVPEQQRSKDSVLQVFWSLADVKKETRIEATRDFLNIKSVLDVESSDHAYSVKRLVRGLTSSRGAARQGFSVALTQLIRNCPEIDVDQVLEQLNQVTEVNGSMKADVKRGYWIGRLFGYLSLVRSGRCSNEKVLVGIIQGCLVLGKKKDWMREFSTEIICDILNLMNEGELTRTLDEVKNFGAFTEKTFKEISAWELSLLCTLDECTLNKRKAQEAFHRHITFRIPHVKAEEEGNSWEELVEPLRLASTTFPRLHSVWPKLVRIACADGTESFKSLWELIEQHFVVEGSHQRRYCAIKLFEYSTSYLVETGKFEWVRDVLLTETFLKFLVHNAVSEERYLFAVANRALSHLGNALAADNVSRFYRLAILGYIRTYAPKNFDKRSKSELSSKLLSIKDIADDAKSTSAQIKHLQKLFQEQLTSGNDNPWTVDALYCVCRNIKDGDVRLETSGKVAEFLFEKMFFLSKKSAEPAPESFQQMCCSVISKLITDMVLHESSAYNTMTKEDEKSQAKYWKQKLDWGKVEKLNEMYDKMQSSSVVSISEDEAKARSAALTAVKKLKKSKIDNELMLGISLIVQNLSLQSILLEVGTGESEMEVNIDIPELLSDLTMCCDRLSSKKNKKNDLDPMVVLTDVLIAVESQPSMLLRAVVKNSFRLISSQSTASSIEAILDVLMSRHTVDIKNKGKEEGGSDDEEEGESGEEEEEEEEEEDKMEDKMEEDEEEDDSEKQDSDDEMSKEDRALEAFVQAKLKAKADTGKKVQRRQEKEKLQIKLRVLDLVETFVTYRPNSELITLLPVPLMRAAVACFVHGGSNFKSGPNGMEAKSLFNRILKIQEILARKAGKVTVDGSSMVSLSENGPCATALFDKRDKLTVRGKNGKIKDISNDAPESVSVKNLLERTLGLGLLQARKAKQNGKVQRVCTYVTEFALRTGAGGFVLPQDVVQYEFELALNETLGKRGKGMPASLFTNSMTKVPQYISAILPVLCEQTKNAKAAFQRAEGLRLIQDAVRASAKHPLGDDLIENMLSLFAGMLEMIVEISDPGFMKPNRNRDVFRGLNLINRQILQKHKMKRSKALKSIEEKLKSIVNSDNDAITSELKTLAQQALRNLFKIEVAFSKKRKLAKKQSSELNGEEEAAAEPAKKTKKQKLSKKKSSEANGTEETTKTKVDVKKRKLSSGSDTQTTQEIPKKKKAEKKDLSSSTEKKKKKKTPKKGKK